MLARFPRCPSKAKAVQQQQHAGVGRHEPRVICSCPNFAFDSPCDAPEVPASSSNLSFPWLDSASSPSNRLHTLNLVLLIVPHGQCIKNWATSEDFGGSGAAQWVSRTHSTAHKESLMSRPLAVGMINCKERFQSFPAPLLTLLFGFFGCRSPLASRTSMRTWTRWPTCTPTRSATRTRRTRTCWRASSKPSRASRFSAAGWRRASKQTVRRNFPSKYSGLQVVKLV